MKKKAKIIIEKKRVVFEYQYSYENGNKGKKYWIKAHRRIKSEKKY